jgi:sulfur carrier protein ThiS
MAGAIQLRGFMWLADLFKSRHWSNPKCLELDGDISGPELLAKLDIAPERVEVMFVNGRASSPATAIVKPGDRVALVPPGTPGPYRMLLGFTAPSDKSPEKA